MFGLGWVVCVSLTAAALVQRGKTWHGEFLGALEQCLADVDQLDERAFRDKYAASELLTSSPSRKELQLLRPAAGDGRAALTWEEQRSLFRQRVTHACTRVGSTFGRFVHAQAILYDGFTILVAGTRAPEAVGRTQAELEAELDAAWEAGDQQPLNLAQHLQCQTSADGKYHQKLHGQISATVFARFFGPEGFEVLVNSGAHVLDMGQRNILAGGVLVQDSSSQGGA